jgi:hypothetical protein
VVKRVYDLTAVAFDEGVVAFLVNARVALEGLLIRQVGVTLKFSRVEWKRWMLDPGRVVVSSRPGLEWSFIQSSRNKER